MHTKSKTILLIPSIWLVSIAHAFAGTARTLVEDFTNIEHADFSVTTGIWNTAAHRAQAGAVADGDPLRPISFGDGSDGVLDSLSGYHFDTDTHPNGFNFKSVNITAGTIDVVGSYPLIIRSQGPVKIIPDLSVSGGDGQPGSAADINATAGGRAVAGRGAGGSGGRSTGSAAADLNGGDGLDKDGNDVALSLGVGRYQSGPVNIDGNATFDTPAADFDVSGFICGSGGGGGGGQWQNASDYGSGGGGGAGGGVLRISAVGEISMGRILARGGHGGNAVQATTCSGNGAGGNGGAVWIQSLSAVTTTSKPDIAGGSGGSIAACAGPLPAWDGYRRVDCPVRPVVWNVDPNTGYYDTSLAAPSKAYTVQSKPLDLGTMNAAFSGAPTIESDSSAGGSIRFEYAGSGDSTSLSDFTDDITKLSDRNYRYLVIKITIQTAAAPAVSPSVSRISIPYEEFGFQSANLKLSPGCGTLDPGDSGNSGSSGNHTDRRQEAVAGLLVSLFWTVLCLGARISMRLTF